MRLVRLAVVAVLHHLRVAERVPPVEAHELNRQARTPPGALYARLRIAGAVEPLARPPREALLALALARPPDARPSIGALGHSVRRVFIHGLVVPRGAHGAHGAVAVPKVPVVAGALEIAGEATASAVAVAVIVRRTGVRVAMAVVERDALRVFDYVDSSVNACLLVRLCPRRKIYLPSPSVCEDDLVVVHVQSDVVRVLHPSPRAAALVDPPNDPLDGRITHVRPPDSAVGVASLVPISDVHVTIHQIQGDAVRVRQIFVNEHGGRRPVQIRHVHLPVRHRLVSGVYPVHLLSVQVQSYSPGVPEATDSRCYGACQILLSAESCRPLVQRTSFYFALLIARITVRLERSLGVISWHSPVRIALVPAQIQSQSVRRRVLVGGEVLPCELQVARVRMLVGLFLRDVVHLHSVDSATQLVNKVHEALAEVQGDGSARHVGHVEQRGGSEIEGASSGVIVKPGVTRIGTHCEVEPRLTARLVNRKGRVALQHDSWAGLHTHPTARVDDGLTAPTKGILEGVVVAAVTFANIELASPYSVAQEAVFRTAVRVGN
mmetsp:Transcript_17375/g.35294  ORF Transcript_17375/g.35294 Transcript_17375/m.35294 type:complete len:550 (+) Transcript_17375:768-2417(+)